MSYWKKLIGMAFLTPVLSVGVAAPVVKAPQSVTSEMVKPGEKKLVVTLKESPTTGYSWALSSYDAKLLKPVSFSYAEDKHARGMVGVGGVSTWTFEVLPVAHTVPQVTSITWTYGRPWNAVDPVNRHKTIVYFVK